MGYKSNNIIVIKRRFPAYDVSVDLREASFYAQKRIEYMGDRGYTRRSHHHPVGCSSEFVLVDCAGGCVDLRWSVAYSLRLKEDGFEDYCFSLPEAACKAYTHSSQTRILTGILSYLVQSVQRG